jgi:hypothetical protein
MKNDRLEILSELDKLEKEHLSDKAKTLSEKNKFIQQIKMGLGEEIRKNPNKVTIIKKPKMVGFIEKIKKIIFYVFKMF